MLDNRVSVLCENGGRRDGRHRRIEPLVRLRVLQYMNIIHMKRLLAREVSTMSERGYVTTNQMARVRKLMKGYVGALRDLQYMLEPTSRFSRTGSFLRQQFYINMQNDSAILESEGLVHPDFHFPKGGYDVPVPEYAGYGGFSHTRDTEGQLSQEFLGRLRVAILTGLSLIAPMLFMKLYNNLPAQLTTASVAVLVLGAVLAYLEEMRKKDVVTATAAYAAVLVVFIGTSS
ncbi:hypothetical protein B0T19DRAFT_445335 [Cercophora scortea]|uniref:DUF6594 domain-containing protein n=1 Tax=Cercophora scortea TaxID=314031 RepID=A0AAE0I6R5_9PEZI|nr:hypothetical protein B0T19DRAFT_445335 [Cercophora scortea]